MENIGIVQTYPEIDIIVPTPDSIRNRLFVIINQNEKRMTPMDENRAAYLAKKLLELLNDNPDGISPPLHAILDLRKRIGELTSQEAKTDSSGREKFNSIVTDVARVLVGASLVSKERGNTWKLTSDGASVLADIKDDQHLWAEAQRRNINFTAVTQGATPEQPPASENTELPHAPAEFEQLSGRGWREFYEVASAEADKHISRYLHDIDAHRFETIVSTLLKAMGYHIQFSAPEHGKDGGVDLIACLDPFGVSSRRLKVQCKRWKGNIGIAAVKSFVANVGEAEVGVLVCLGGYTQDVEMWVKAQPRHITLVNEVQLIDLWTTHYGKMSEQDRKIFPLMPKFMLTPTD
jgi:restriction system protein